MATKALVLELAGREVTLTNPDKVYFPEAGITKRQLAEYYVKTADGAVRGIYRRPIVLKRYVNGIHDEFFYQKRAPAKRPDWVEAVQIRFPSGRTADEIVVSDVAQLIWIVNLGTIDLNPHPVRVDDLEHPDELRVDLDPGPGVAWDTVRRVTLTVRDVLRDHGLEGWPKTSGSKGMHVLVRIAPRWTFDDVRRAALAVAREVERRVPDLATSKWWKEERHGVFLDYNQNAKDRTVCSAYSVRPVPEARVSTPLVWDEVPTCEPAAFTLFTLPERYQRIGDLHARIDEQPGSLEALLALAAKQAEQGHEEAPWPPHYAKRDAEPDRAPPSKRRRRQGAHALLTIAKAAREADARSGLERWKARHPEAAAHLAIDDVLVDAMRGRSTTWTRIRVNLRHVPDTLRPEEEPPDPDYDPWKGVS
jgi:bifunctional non-homologous end joining protein LigD